MNLIPTLHVLVPVPITDAVLISSTALENDYPVWNTVDTYAKGDRRISTATHRIYESLKDANTNKDPTDINNRVGTSPWWIDSGPTNKHAMFDDEVSTQTIVTSPLTVVLKPGFFNAFWLGGLDAEEMDIVVKDAPGGNVIHTYSGALEGSAPADYYEYFFERFKPKTSFFAQDIDQYLNAEVTLTLNSSSTPVKCGFTAFGDLRPLGATQYGAKVKPRTFSSVKTDEFGRTGIKRRKRTKDMTMTAWIKRDEAKTVLDTITELLDVPCVWVGPDDICFGLGSGEVSFDYPNDCLLTVNVQGMI